MRDLPRRLHGEWRKSGKHGTKEKIFGGPQMIRCLNMIIRVGVLLLFLTLDSDCKVPSGYSSRLACVAGV